MGRWRLGRLALAALMALALWGCGVAPERPAPEAETCRALLTELDHAIGAATHFEPGLRRVDGWPLLRTNRFLASFAYEELSPNARTAWLGHAFELARNAYATEFARLDAGTREGLQDRHGFADLDTRLASCFADSAPPETLDPAAYRVPDGYSTAARAMGLYPVTSLVARGFISGYRRDMTARYMAGRATRFERETVYAGPETRDASAPPPATPDTDALGIPRLSDGEQDALFRRFMPQLAVEQRSGADRIGAPLLDEHGRIEIDTTRPVVFTFPSHTRLGSRVLLQLNYAFWFPERPPEHGLDLYAGDLSGVLWRVTLDHELRPVLYDSIHQCGCYHKLFLPAGSRIDLDGLVGERPLVFALPPGLAGDRGLRLRLEAGTHYIIDVGEAMPSADTEHYILKDYAWQLRLPAAGTVRSLFGPTGIVQQSQRPERFVLWPLGVPSAGAMRQRGLHAIAFVGHRHFDDPDLLETLAFDFDPR
ncbi:MAG: hypothetical protein EA347_07300 [Thioalkalivibrio sp.]|nr:MAG: hypothetical protein EA347_07300 [Thioalkalivibrio sp.]